MQPLTSTSSSCLDLPCSDTQRKDIDYVIRTLATPKFLAFAIPLQKCKERLVPLHPLKFLEILFLDDDLTKKMPRVLEGTLTGPEFLDNLCKSIRNSISEGELWKHVDSFAQSLQVPREEIAKCINEICKSRTTQTTREKTAALVQYLLGQRTSPQEEKTSQV